jgi:ribonuclease HIII
VCFRNGFHRSGKIQRTVSILRQSQPILNRFIDWIDKTSLATGNKLPLGASDAVIHAARDLISRLGADALGKSAKLHFRTTSIIQSTDK